MTSKRFSSLLLLCFATVFAVFANAAQRLPNIVIIFIDDQGYADIGPFGAKGWTTPNLERLAAEGCKFTNFHASQPVCSASRTALLTGCYSNRIGIHGALGPGARHGIADTEMTLAQLVKQKGYATGMAGKWHLGHHPQFLPIHHGFDEYFGLPYSNDMWPLHPEAKKGAYPPLPLIEGDKVLKTDLGHADQEQLTTQYTERAVKFIEKNKDRPFFFYLAHSMVHVPLHVSDKFRGKSQQGLYGDACMEVDWSVGEVMKALKRAGVEDNTWLIYTSDNGPWLSYGNHAGSAYPLREGKGTCWEGGTREPCLMRWPGKIPAGSTSGEMLMTIDLFPTIAKLIGAELPKHKIDGLDVWPLIVGQEGAKNPHEAYYGYFVQNQLQAVTSGDGRWKLQLPHTYNTLGGRPGGTNGIPAKYEPRKIEQPDLYDLVNDVSEATSVADKNPEVVKRLLALAEQAREDLGDTLTERQGKGVREPGRVAGEEAPAKKARKQGKQASLPAPWLHQDIGAVEVKGDATFTAGTFTLKGMLDVWGTNDGCHYVFQRLTGDGEITARVTAVENTQGHAKAGVMIRESFDAGAREITMAVTPVDGAQFLFRTNVNDKTNVAKVGTNKGVFPYWVKLERSGNEFTGYESTDGANWTKTGSATVSMSKEALVGLMTSSHLKDKLCEATLDKVELKAKGR